MDVPGLSIFQALLWGSGASWAQATWKSQVVGLGERAVWYQGVSVETTRDLYRFSEEVGFGTTFLLNPFQGIRYP